MRCITARVAKTLSAGQSSVRCKPIWLRRMSIPCCRYDRHVRHCATCQRAFPHVTRVCWALTALAALATVAAATAMTLAALSPAGAAAVGGGWRLAAAVAAAAGLAAAAVGAWEWREVRFVSGLRAWQRRGGLGAPVTHKGGKK